MAKKVSVVETIGIVGRVVIKHLKSETVWPHEADIVSTGILLQVVDDLLDYRHDMDRGELNFLRDEQSHYYVTKLMEWDYKKLFCDSRHPLVLFTAIRRAQSIAAKVAIASEDFHASSNGSMHAMMPLLLRPARSGYLSRLCWRR